MWASHIPEMECGAEQRSAAPPPKILFTIKLRKSWKNPGIMLKMSAGYGSVATMSYETAMTEIELEETIYLADIMLEDFTWMPS